MFIEISAVFKIQDPELKDDYMFAKPTVRFLINDKETSFKKQYEALKNSIRNNIPDGYIILDATKEDLEEYEDENN